LRSSRAFSGYRLPGRHSGSTARGYHIVCADHVDINGARTKFDAESRLTDEPSLDSLRQLLKELKDLTLQLRASRHS